MPKETKQEPGDSSGRYMVSLYRAVPAPIGRSPKKKVPGFLMTANFGEGELAVPAHAGTGSRYTRQNQGRGNPSFPVYDDG